MTKVAKINRLWHGFASVRDYIVKEALLMKQDLLIEMNNVGNEQMLIPAGEIEKRIKNTSKTIFQSKHENRQYRLIDFEWKPTNRQTLLF